MNRIENRRRGRLALLFSVLLLAFVFLLLRYASRTAEAVREGLSLCSKTLIPALFPFLVVSNLLTRVGAPERWAAVIGRPFGKRFGIRPVCFSAVIVGALCGFPTGAVFLNRLRKQGLCDEEDFRRTLFLSSSAAPGFVIAGIGGGMLGDFRLGVLLWIGQLAVLLGIGRLRAVICRREADLRPYPVRSEPLAILPAAAESLKEASSAMLGIVGTVVFFSIPAAGIASLSGLPEAIRAILTGVLELTNGAALAARLPIAAALPVMGGILGWSGLSVHSQIFLVTEGKGGGGFFLWKLLAGAVMFGAGMAVERIACV